MAQLAMSSSNTLRVDAHKVSTERDVADAKGSTG